MNRKETYEVFDKNEYGDLSPVSRVKVCEGEDQDGRVEGHRAQLLLQIHQKYIHMWNNSPSIPTESLQKVSSNQSCRKDRRRRGIGMGPEFLEGSCERGKVLSLWNLFHWLGGSSGQIGSFRGLRGECGSWHEAKQDKERPAQMVLATSSHFPARDMYLLVCAVTGCWNSSFSGLTWGENLALLCRDSLKGLECSLGQNWSRMECRFTIGAPLST